MKAFSRPCYCLIALFLAILIGCQSVDKEDAANFFLKGNVQFAKSNYDNALLFYEEALAKYPDFADAHLNKGLTLLQLGRTNDAFQSFTQAIDADEQLHPAYLARAEAATRLGFWNEALNDLTAIRQHYADSSQYFLIKGNVWVGRNDLSAALADFDRSIELDPANAEALVNRGTLYFEQQQYAAAKADFENALRANPRQLQALNNLGLLASRNRQWQTALDYFDQALSVNPVDPIALNNKGYVLLHTGQIDEAFTLVNRSLENKPDNAYALRNLGLYYFKKNDLEKSMNTFKKALDLAQNVELLHGYAGDAFFKAGQRNQACEIWRTGIVLNDSLADAQYANHCR